MELKNHKAGLLSMLFIPSIVLLCYCLLSNELLNIYSQQPVTNVSSLWKPSQYDEFLTREPDRTSLKYVNTHNKVSAKVDNVGPRTIHLKTETDTEKQRSLTFCGDNSATTVSPETPLDGCRLLEHRARVVQQTCQHYNVLQAPPGTEGSRDGTEAGNYVEYVSPSTFYLLHSASTLTCVINKVASTSLVTSLMQASGQPVPLTTSPHTVAAAILQPKTKEEFEFARKHFFKFLIVRHPFKRLLSAYQDKVEAAQHWSLKELQKHIFMTLTEAHQTERKPKNDSQNSDDDVPTFSDFLEYILITNETGGGFNSHWVPYWHLCSPCAIQYDAVAKLETAHNDLKYIWHHMGLKEETVPWINRSSHKTTNSSTLNHYYQDLHPDLIARVYHHYLLDFEMFQYNILDVVREGGHCQIQDCSDMISFFS